MQFLTAVSDALNNLAYVQDMLSVNDDTNVIPLMRRNYEEVMRRLILRLASATPEIETLAGIVLEALQTYGKELSSISAHKSHRDFSRAAAARKESLNAAYVLADACRTDLDTAHQGT